MVRANGLFSIYISVTILSDMCSDDTYWLTEFSRLQASISDLSISVYIQQTKDHCDGVIMHALQDNTYNAIMAPCAYATYRGWITIYDIIRLHELGFVCLPQKSIDLYIAMYATAIALSSCCGAGLSKSMGSPNLSLMMSILTNQPETSCDRLHIQRRLML